MSNDPNAPRCPHCDSKLARIGLPDGSGWEGTPHRVCFNDECSYYREGWDWMWEHYRAKASYRFRLLDAEAGTTSPLPVWSEDAIRDRIIEED